VFKALINDEQIVTTGEEVCEKYKTLHSSSGCVRLLCFTVFTIVRDPHQLHKFSSFLWEMEEILHSTRTNIFTCLRCKIGSDQIASKLFDNLDPPGWFKKKLSFTSNEGMKYFNKISPVLLKILLSIFKTFLLTWDMVKDVVLWIFLYDRIGFLFDGSGAINGEFVVYLIWFNLGTILFAQCMMGAFILSRADKIIKIAESVAGRRLLYCLLVLMLPFVPCILLLQVSYLAIQESKHVLQWEKISNSPSSVAKALLAIKKEKVFVTDTYSHLRLLEGVCESFPQIVLLLAYFIVTILNPASLSISENLAIDDDDNEEYSIELFGKNINLYGTIFFIFNILYSVLTLLFSLVNTVNAAKGGQLRITQKACLSLVYFFQLLARLVPIFFVLLLTISSAISHAAGLLLLCTPPIFHLVCQYLITYYTAPLFRNLDTFQKVIHILANTVLVFPLKSQNTGKQEHRSREIFWSLVLMTLEIVGTGVGIWVALWHIPEHVHPKHPDSKIFITNVIHVFLPILPCTLCAAYLSQCLYYRSCHTWSSINKPYYPFYSCHYSSICGSYREQIVEEVVEVEEGEVEARGDMVVTEEEVVLAKEEVSEEEGGDTVNAEEDAVKTEKEVVLTEEETIETMEDVKMFVQSEEEAVKVKEEVVEVEEEKIEITEDVFKVKMFVQAEEEAVKAEEEVVEVEEKTIEIMEDVFKVKMFVQAAEEAVKAEKEVIEAEEEMIETMEDVFKVKMFVQAEEEAVKAEEEMIETMEDVFKVKMFVQAEEEAVKAEEEVVEVEGETIETMEDVFVYNIDIDML